MWPTPHLTPRRLHSARAILRARWHDSPRRLALWRDFGESIVKHSAPTSVTKRTHVRSASRSDECWLRNASDGLGNVICRIILKKKNVVLILMLGMYSCEYMVWGAVWCGVLRFQKYGGALLTGSSLTTSTDVINSGAIPIRVAERQIYVGRHDR